MVDSKIMNDKNKVSDITPNYPKNKKLIYAQVVWRHGLRNPAFTYNTSLCEDKHFIGGKGELVQRGIQEHHLLAEKLRRRYVDDTGLLSPEFTEDEIHVRSSNVKRTKLSAECHFSAFYSDSSTNSPADTPPRVTINQWSEVEDPVLLAIGCEKAIKFMKDVIFKTPEFQDFIAENTQFIQIISEKSGHEEFTDFLTEDYDFWDLYQIVGLCDTIIHEVLLDLPRAEWVDEMYEKCDKFVDDFYEQIFGLKSDENIKKEAGKIFGGQLLWEIIDRFKKKHAVLNNPKKQTPNKYFVYSGHDISLIQLLSALGIGKIGVDFRRPETSDALSLELWQGDDGSNVIKVYYFDKEKPEPIDLSKMVTGAENTEEGASLEQFIERSLVYKPECFGR